MWRTAKAYYRQFWRGVALCVGMTLLAGCASTLSARVTSYQQWPADAQGASYHIVPSANQVNNLQFQSFADMIRANIGPVGLIEAPNAAAARFDVHVDYSNPVTQTWVRQYNDPYLNDGWGFGPSFGWFGGGPYWGGAVYYPPSVSTVPVMVYKNTLTVTINDRQRKGAEVYRSTAVNVSGSDNLAQAMPYLARAVFDGFPGNNGQVREVEYERGR